MKIIFIMPSVAVHLLLVTMYLTKKIYSLRTWELRITINFIKRISLSKSDQIKHIVVNVGPFPRSEAKCEAIDMKMFFFFYIFMQIKVTFTAKVLHVASF